MWHAGYRIQRENVATVAERVNLEVNWVGSLLMIESRSCIRANQSKFASIKRRAANDTSNGIHVLKATSCLGTNPSRSWIDLVPALRVALHIFVPNTAMRDGSIWVVKL